MRDPDRQIWRFPFAQLGAVAVARTRSMVVFHLVQCALVASLAGQPIVQRSARFTAVSVPRRCPLLLFGAKSPSSTEADLAQSRDPRKLAPQWREKCYASRAVGNTLFGPTLLSRHRTGERQRASNAISCSLSSPPSMVERLFVYGSLQPGGPNEHVLAAIGGEW